MEEEEEEKADRHTWTVILMRCDGPGYSGE